MKLFGRSYHPWPLAIIAFFIFFFAGLVAFIIFAARQHVDLVRVDYYEQEVRYQEQLERIQRTRQIQEPLALDYHPSSQTITLRLPLSQAAHSSGSIQLYRPSNARLDREVPLALNADGAQSVDARTLAPGLWKVRVQWRVSGHEYYMDRAMVITRSSS